MALREDRFERLYAEHAPGLLGFLVYRTGDAATAEDLLAETFVRVLRARGRFDRRRGSEKRWIYAIAVNCATDHHRRRQAERRALERLEADAVDTDGDLRHVEDRDTLVRALRRLPADEVEAIALRYGADLPMKQIAEVTGQPTTTIEGRVYRGLARLRDHLSQ